MRDLCASTGGVVVLAMLWPLGAAGAGPTTGPTVPGGGGANPAVPVATAMPAPYDLQFATDPATCDKWRTGLPPRASDPCLDLANRANSGTFYWQWRGNGAHPTAPGFNLYRVDNGRHDKIVQQYSSNEGDTIIMFGSVVPGACYAVTAWDLSPAESAPSPSYCMNTVRPAPPAHQEGPVRVAPGVPVQMEARLPAPSRPLGTKDLKACAPHGGLGAGLACQALLPKGGLALVWDYGPTHIDGFRAYEVPSPAAATPGAVPATVAMTRPGSPIATQSQRLDNGGVATIVVLDPRPRGFEGACFAVTAFLGSEESEKSPPFCVAPGAAGH